MQNIKGKEIQKRWRSIRDSYTKAFRQGKCVLPEHCPSTSRRYQYHRQMSFLLRALQNKKPRASQDKQYESFSEVSNSPQHPPPEDFVPRIKSEPLVPAAIVEQKPLDLKTRPDTPEKSEASRIAPTVDKANQVTIEDIEQNHGVEMRNPSLEIKIDANSILPDDHFNDDKLFMNSLLPLFKKMDDDTRLLCRIEVLKIIRYALQGHKCFEALKIAEDSFFRTRISGILAKEETESNATTPNGSTLSMTTRSADGSRPIRKRRLRSPSPPPAPPKRRGPGRPRKVRPPPSDSEEDEPRKKRQTPAPFVPAPNLEPRLSELDEELSRATSVAQLETPLFMKMYNLERTKKQTNQNTQCITQIQASVKTEPFDVMEAAA